MRQSMKVNNFEVEFWSDSYPLWTTIKYDGKEIARINHKEVRDLEYALGRIRELLRTSLQTNNKHEA